MEQPTQKYINERNRLAKYAFRLFRDKGFAETSFQDIAAAANIRKSLVQYYFPSKEIFIRLFLEQTMQYIFTKLDLSKQENEGPLDKFFLVGYFEGWYLCCHESMDKLREEILGSRVHSSVITDCVTEFFYNNLPPLDNEIYKKIEQALSFAIGGAFEYVFRENRKGNEINIDRLVDLCAEYISDFIGLPPDTPIKVKQKMDDDWLREKALEVDRIMFEEL